MTQQAKAYIFALSAVLLWSTVATAFKISLKQLTYSELLLISSGTSLIVLTLLMILKIYFSKSIDDSKQNEKINYLNKDKYHLFFSNTKLHSKIQLKCHSECHSERSEESHKSLLPQSLRFFTSFRMTNKYILSLKATWYKLKYELISEIVDYKGLMFSIALGFLNPFLYYLILFKAYSILPAQEAISLNYTWGIIVVLLSIIFLKQKIHFINIFFLIISFIGVVIIATGGNFTDLHFKNPEGVIYALSSALVWGLFWILNMKDRRSDLIKLFLNFFFGFIFVLIYNLFFTSFKMQFSSSFIAAVYVGIFEMGITFVFWLKALQLSKTTALVSNLAYLSPFLSLFFVSIIIKEEIQFSTIIGLIFIVIGIILQNLFNIKPTTISK